MRHKVKKTLDETIDLLNTSTDTIEQLTNDNVVRYTDIINIMDILNHSKIIVDEDRLAKLEEITSRYNAITIH